MATSKTSKTSKTKKRPKGAKGAKRPRRAFEGRQALIPGVKPRKTAATSTTSAGDLAAGDPSRMTIVTVQASVGEVNRWRAAAMAEGEKPHASAFCARAATAAADKLLGKG